MLVQSSFALSSLQLLPHMKSGLRMPRLTSIASLWNLNMYASSLSDRSGPKRVAWDTTRRLSKLEVFGENARTTVGRREEPTA